MPNDLRLSPSAASAGSVSVPIIVSIWLTLLVRTPADLDRRQSLSYMKQVDSIVQSFDIQDDEIEFERDEEGNDLVLGHGAFGQVSTHLKPAPPRSNTCARA